MSVLPEIDYQVLTALQGKAQPISIDELSAEIGRDQSQVSAVCVTYGEQGLLAIETEEVRELAVGKVGQQLHQGGPWPENEIVAALADGEVHDIAELSREADIAVGQYLRVLEAKGLARRQGRSVQLAPGAEPQPQADEQLVRALCDTFGGRASEAEVRRQYPAIDIDRALLLLQGRKGVIDVRARRTRLVALTGAGRALVDGGLKPRRQVTQLGSELLRSGEWRDADLRPYDVTLPAQTIHPAKVHPIVSIFEQTRRVFLELGFSEIVSPYVESSFWDFDALFQPQDHPARDMQDTFYIERPAEARLPDDALVERVRRTHEDGGETGSVGWRYRWSRDLARRPVLRTHTTASTIRALAADPRPPRKVFCVGPVFRRETVDYKHLPVFHQVDGIIIDERATFANLLGTLQAFYRKMGFDRFQFRPAFFPYTEPSVEVFVWAESKRDWVEMGGAGIFRPEVTLPFGCRAPVLAWGLGLERLAMFRYQLGSIGELYRSRLAWLKETPLCR